MTLSKHKLAGFLIVLPLIVAVLTGLKEYVVWPQITYMWQSRLPMLEGFQEFGAHGLRYAVMYPIMWSAEQSGMSADTLFSYVILLIVYFTGRNCVEAIRVRHPQYRPGVRSVLFIFGTLTLLFFLMNGRISIAFLGYSILLRALLLTRQSDRIGLKTGLMILAGLVMCGVSSGVLVSASGALLITLGVTIAPAIARMRLTRTHIVLLLVSVLLAYIVGNSLIIGMAKNLAFYGGFTEMLHHGYGRILLGIIQGVPTWLLIAVAVVIILLGMRLVLMFRYPYLTAIFLFACVCGAFGTSTLTVAAIPGMILATLYSAGVAGSASRAVAPDTGMRV